MKSGFTRGFRDGFKRYGENSVVLVNAIILIIVYFTSVAATALAARIMGKKFLDLKPDDSDTYWRPIEHSSKMEDYYRQF